MDTTCIFWGKLRDDGTCLPLPCHCLDVAIVFRALCDLPGIHRALEHAAGRPLSEQDKDRLTVFAHQHDPGKANLGFQYKRWFEMRQPTEPRHPLHGGARIETARL